MPFPATKWRVVDALKGDDAEASSIAMAEVIDTYGPPLLAFSLRRRRDKTREDCEDLVNEYFTRCIEAGLLKHAEQAKGRFRNFLLASFKHFVSNEDRARRAKKRAPTGGLVSLDSLTEQFGFALEPRTPETPEAAFDKTLRFVRFKRALLELEKRCHEANDELKYLSFFARDIKPAIGGSPVPGYATLAKEWGTSENALNKKVLTARAEFNDLLRAAVARDGSSSEEIDSECRLIVATVLKG
jgi:RNA polymerase sigma-70 factor (ECF subfamily)